MIERAQAFATRWHESIGQKRKYTQEPYISHPAAVVRIVRTVPHSDKMLAAAWLHDVVEDTPCTHADIEQEFGWDVASLVWHLTDISKPEDGNRAFRKSLDRLHLSRAPVDAKTIKLADMIDNSRSILKYDPDFAKVYLHEKRLLLNESLIGGDPTLWCLADAIVAKPDKAEEIMERYLGALGKVAD